jgi:hypothetical protein
MKIRHPWLIRFLAFVAAWLVLCWICTLRHRLLVVDGREHPADARHERYLYAFWHEALLLPALFRARIHFRISQHADGEFIAHVCRHLGAGVVRGSTTRGGGPALMEMMRWSRRTHLGITPDGPRGPRRRDLRRRLQCRLARPQLGPHGHSPSVQPGDARGSAGLFGAAQSRPGRHRALSPARGRTIRASHGNRRALGGHRPAAQPGRLGQAGESREAQRLGPTQQVPRAERHPDFARIC